MTSNQKKTEPFDGFTEDQLTNLEESIKTLDQEDESWEQEKKIAEEEKQRRLSSVGLRRLRKSPLEIINRLLFFVFLGSFLFSFVSVYATSFWWFVGYIFSAFSCILYLPNRKALKELIAAWPNIQDLLRNRRFWKK